MTKFGIETSGSLPKREICAHGIEQATGTGPIITPGQCASDRQSVIRRVKAMQRYR